MLQDSHYHRIKGMEGDIAVRSLVRRELRRSGGNVSATARAMGCSRLTVRRARDGTLEDGDRTPQTQPGRTPETIETIVLRERRKTGYGRRRLARYLIDVMNLRVSEHTVRNILRRANR
jgi:hypothetical protein